MDITWVTDRIGVGGGIWTAEGMAKVARAGITHIIDMQIEFDDTPLAILHGIKVLWNPTDDDFQPKTPDMFQQDFYSLRRRSSPRTDDDAGTVVLDGLEDGGCHAAY